MFHTKKTKFWKCIRLRCKKHSRLSKSSRGEIQSSHTGCAANHGELCKFELQVYYNSSLRRFFIRENSGSNFLHSKHPPVKREFRRTGTNAVPADQLEKAVELLEKNCPTDMVNLVLQVLGNNKLTKGSMDYLRRSVLITKHGNDNSESTGSTMLRLLEEKGAAFCYFTGSYSEATKKVRVYKHSKKKKKKKKKRKPTQNEAMFDGAFGNNNDTDNNGDGDRTEEINNPDKEAANYVEAVIKALDLGNGEILLGIAWALEEGVKR